MAGPELANLEWQRVAPPAKLMAELFKNNGFNNNGFNIDIIEFVDLIDDLGMDFVTFIMMIINIEERFDIIIPDYVLEMNNFRTIHSIYNLINLLKQGELQDD